MSVSVLPNVQNEELLFVTLDFNLARDAMTEGKLLIERLDLVAARAVFLK
jgi:hypothetical protein